MKSARFLFIPLSLLTLSSCGFVKGMEHELNIVFEYNGEIISHTTVNEFKNGVSPTLSNSMIPVNHKFYGWTWLNPDSIDIRSYADSKNRISDDFYKTFIEYDDVVHYDEVKDYAFNSTVVLRPLFIDESIIPVPTYYISIGWYAKTSTSGLTNDLMNKWKKDLEVYLISEGATQENIEDIKITPYEGDVATAGSLVNKDRFNDILIGFGGNIGTLGGIDYKENIGGIPMGGKTRYITKLNEKPLTEKVFTWLQTEDGYKSLS